MSVNKHPRPPGESNAPNAAQLRAAIDGGRTGDKRGFPDPAAAPLGTDDEAAGTPETPAQVAAAQAAEIRGRPATSGRGRPGIVALAGIVALLAVAAALWLAAGL